MSNTQVGFTKPEKTTGTGCEECFTTPELNTLITTRVTQDDATIQAIHDAIRLSGELVEVQDAFGVPQYLAFQVV